jgi:hypothetical protein
LSVTIILLRRAHALKWGCAISSLWISGILFLKFLWIKISGFLLKDSYWEITFKNSNVISMSFIQFKEGGSLLMDFEGIAINWEAPW